MSRIRTSLVLAVISSFVWCCTAVTAAGPAQFSGMVYADAQVALQGHSVPADSSSFRFRRVQFTFDQDLDSVFSVRFQIEADDANLSTSGRTVPYLKQAWLRWSRLGVLGEFTMGLSVTPTWSIAETHWAYRSLERTVLDLQGFGAPTDLGVALQRMAPATGGAGYHLMLANGSAQKPEQNASKKLMLSVPVRFASFIAEAMADYEGESGAKDRYTTKLFGGWQRGEHAVGAEAYWRSMGGAGPLGAASEPSGASVFARAVLSPRWRLVARADRTDADRRQDASGYTETYVLVAVDYMPMPNVHVMPNVVVRAYAPKAASIPDREADRGVRVTLWYNWR